MDDKEEHKMWIAVRSDLNIPMGKAMVQSGHAFQLLTIQVLETRPELMKLYMTDQSIVKIAVEAENEEHLLKIAEQCRISQIPFSLIKDSGRTVFREPTYTVVSFGPWLRSKLPPKLKRLQLYKEEKVQSASQGVC